MIWHRCKFPIKQIIVMSYYYIDEREIKELPGYGINGKSK